LESDNRKYTVLSLLILSSLIAYVFYLVITQLSDIFRFGGSNVFHTGFSWQVVGGSISILFAVILFVVLMIKQNVVDFSDDVFAELKKTTWPNFKETTSSTIVVSVMVLIAAVILFAMDVVWSSVFKFII